MTLNATLAVAVTANLRSVLDLGEALAPLTKNYRTVLATGVAAGQADRVFHDQRTLAASANEDLDLAGVLLDPLGALLTFVKIKGIVVAAAAGNTNNVVVGAAVANPWSGLLGAAGTVTVRPGGVFAAFAGAADAAGYPVVAGTGDQLRVANSGAGTPVTYDVIIVGTSA
ncbi:hypothetical protein K1W54_28760 [Micromonospora sp. CPCC 205371]|nr:hypothetical protein [Micromonospora sp. CPCC 205371]